MSGGFINECSEGTYSSFIEGIISRFGSECFDGLEDLQKEFDAGSFVGGGEWFYL